MRAKLMTSAAVLAGALAFATMAQAQTTSSGPNGNVGGNATATDSYNSTDLDLGIADSGNDNSVNDSGNDNSTDLSLGVADSFDRGRRHGQARFASTAPERHASGVGAEFLMAASDLRSLFRVGS